MTTKPDPLDPDDHDQQALEEAEEKMLLRHDEHDEKSADEPSPLGGDHDPDALAEAAEKMLLREERT